MHLSVTLFPGADNAQEGGWTRQTTIRELPSSVELAGVNMRLDDGVIRELHWHKEAEWAYVLEGEVRVTAIDYEGGNFLDDLKKGDLWVSLYSIIWAKSDDF